MVTRIARSAAGSEKGEMSMQLRNHVTLLIAACSLPVIVACSPLTVFARQDTIPERVAANKGKPVVIPLARDLVPVPLADLAAGADLIVYGKLVRQRSYLTEAKRDVYTDYALKAERVIVDRAPVVTGKPQGQSPPMIVTLLGGEVVFEGTHVRLEDMSLRKWNEGADLLMFLRRVSGETNSFEPYGGSAGLFQIEAGQRIRSLLRHGEAGKEFEQLTLDEVVQRIKQQAKR